MLPNLLEKTKQTYISLVLAKCVYTITSFDLWISKMALDVFALVVNFLGEDWMLKHIIIGLFEAFKTSRQTLTRSLQDILEQYGLTKTIIVYVKNECANLITMTFALKSIVSFEALGMIKNFWGPCFGHAFSKVHQYVIITKE